MAEVILLSYILKHYDSDLLKFNIEKTFDGIAVKLLWANKEKEKLLPLGMESNEESIRKWLKARTIPSNRAYVQNFLAKLGLNEKDTKGIIDICKGLSLNDCYWVVDENFKGTFDSVNLYDNHFSRTLAYIAFTGYGSSIRSTFRSSPEFTTNGMLAKCWKRENGKILLYKSGTEGFVAEAMGLNAVEYNLRKYDGRLCSVCELFTNKEVSFVPISRLVSKGGINAVTDYYKKLGDEYFDKLIDMFVFDAVVCNTDRHFGNFGVLVDNYTNKIIDNAPIFDNGLSLWGFAMENELDDISVYVNTRTPATYSDFVEFAKHYITNSQKQKLHKLQNFKFKKHPRYNWSKKRLKTVERVIQERVELLLK